MATKPDHIADANLGNWVERYAPVSMRPYLQLARYDRPIGFWLLAIPCWAGIAMARLDQSWQWTDLKFAVLFGVGALAMRGAGCTYNDILDRDLDAQVTRTASRPLASGALSLRQGFGFLALQIFVGALVWLSLPGVAKWIALAALPLVALYPLMKRITWWPQAWLGLTFNWGALVAYAVIAGQISASALLLFTGLALWTLGYDTIYAHQDREDDALIGVKSTARLFGKSSKWAIGLIYFLALSLLFIAGSIEAESLAPSLQKPALYAVVLSTGLLAMNLANQAFSTNFDDPDQCLLVFKSNRTAGVSYVALLSLGPILLQTLIEMQS